LFIDLSGNGKHEDKGTDPSDGFRHRLRPASPYQSAFIKNCRVSRGPECSSITLPA
jgi:hypothetical protein